MRTLQTLPTRLAVAATWVAFALLFAVTVTATPMVSEKLNQKVHRLGEGELVRFIEQEYGQLDTLSQQLAENPQVVGALLEEDREALFLASTEATRNNSISGILIADRDGRVLSRAHANKYGDYVFEKKSWGPIVADGRPARAFDEGIFDPLIIVSAMPVTAKGAFAGAVSSAQRLDDTFAQRAKEALRWLSLEVVFMHNVFGVTGSTFPENEETARTLQVLSEMWAADHTGGLVNIQGETYHAHAVAIPAYTGSAHGKALLFHRDTAPTQVVLTGIFGAIFMFLAQVAIHLATDTRRRRTTHLRFVLLATLAAGVGTAMTASLQLTVRHEPSKLYEAAIYNSTLALRPESDVVDLNSVFPVTIVLNNGGETVNAVRTEVAFDPRLLEVDSIRTENSLCPQETFIEKSVDHRLGQVVIACMIPAPGFSKRSGAVATINFAPKEVGGADIRFAQDTRVLAHDGLETDVLRTAIDAHYQIIDRAQDNERLIVTSPSHPNSARWYKSPHITAVWRGTPRTLYAYSLRDTVTDTVVVHGTTTASILDLEAPSDGVFALTIEATSRDTGTRRFSSPYTIRIDTTPPYDLGMRVSATSIRTDDVIRLTFAAEDNLSGVQENTYLRIAPDNILLPVRSPVFVPFPEAGRYTITARVYDRAGNLTDESIEVFVSKR